MSKLVTTINESVMTTQDNNYRRNNDILKAPINCLLKGLSSLLCNTVAVAFCDVVVHHAKTTTTKN